MTPEEVRVRLWQTYLEYADQAQKNRNWEAASAFQLAAELALGTGVESVGEPTHHIEVDLGT